MFSNDILSHDHQSCSEALSTFAVINLSFEPSIFYTYLTSLILRWLPGITVRTLSINHASTSQPSFRSCGELFCLFSFFTTWSRNLTNQLLRTLMGLVKTLVLKIIFVLHHDAILISCSFIMKLPTTCRLPHLSWNRRSGIIPRSRLLVSDSLFLCSLINT